VGRRIPAACSRDFRPSSTEAELDALIADCRQHLAKPTTVQTSVIVVQVLGAQAEHHDFFEV